MSNAHTPGPWHVRNPLGENTGPYDTVEVYTEAPSYGTNTSQHGFRTIAICAHRDRRFPAIPERIANARLIAAAPELLEELQDGVEACEAALNSGEPVRLTAALVDIMRTHLAAIAKARGEEK